MAGRADAVETITIVRALGGIGDVLCVVPALKRIRHANPTAEITYLGLPQVRGVVAHYPRLIDRFEEFPGFPGVPEYPFDRARLAGFLDQLAMRPPPDLAIQLHGSGSVSNVFTALLCARRSIGWHIPGLWQPDPTIDDPFPDALNEIDRWLVLAARAGFKAGDATLEFPIAQRDRAAAAAMLYGFGGAPHAVIHVGASDPARRWPTDRFAAIADDLARRGLRIVLTGTAAESPLVDAVARQMGMPFVNLCGRTTLGEAAALIERALLTVTNDTGTSHLCAALGTPSVVIFIASDPARWAPADDTRHIPVGRGVADVPVGQPRAPQAITLPSIDEVRRATTILLEYA